MANANTIELSAAYIKCTFAKIYDEKGRYIFTLQRKDLFHRVDGAPKVEPIMRDVDGNTAGDYVCGILTEEAFGAIQQKLTKVKNSIQKYNSDPEFVTPVVPTADNDYAQFVPVPYHEVKVYARKIAVYLTDNVTAIRIPAQKEKLPWWAVLAGGIMVAKGNGL